MYPVAFTTDEFLAHPAQREDISELQTFTESNPEYWLLTHGRPPPPDDAVQSFERHPPEDMNYSETCGFWCAVYRVEKLSGRLTLLRTCWLQASITWGFS